MWHPTSAAFRVATELSALPIRGATLALGILARLFVTGLGVAAGMALLNRRAGADQLAQAALVASALMDVTVYTTSIFPNNRAPGDTRFYVAASLMYHVGWLIYLWRSKPPESP